MAHAIETMAYAGTDTPWHGLGTSVSRGLTSAAFMASAGLDWEVALQPLYTAGGTAVNRCAVVRLTDGAVVGDAVHPKWTPLQNSEAFAWFDPFIEAGEACYETAGSLSDGRRIWVLAELNRAPAEIVPGDAVRKFLLLSNSHDGSLAVRVGFTPVRVVCQNTLAMAHGSDASKLIRLKHTKGLHAALDDVRGIMNLADAEFESTAEQYRSLARRNINSADLRNYVKTVMGMEDDKDGKLSTRNANILESIVARSAQTADVVSDLLAGQQYHEVASESANAALLESILGGFEGGRGVAEMPKDARTSWWSAYNCVTEHLTHHRGRSEDTRKSSLWYGEGAQINALALQTALTLSA